MLEKKINSLKNIVFVKGSICFALIVCGMWLISSLHDDYDDSLQSMEEIRPMISEARLKLHEITDSNSYVSEGVMKYEEIKNNTEESKCKEYQDILFKIEDLAIKYSLPEPISAVMPPKSSKVNVGHNKASYISVYDLKIEFSAYDIGEALDIYGEILAFLPKYTMIYFSDMKEVPVPPSKSLTLNNPKAKSSLIKCKLYVKMRDVVLMQK